MPTSNTVKMLVSASFICAVVLATGVAACRDANSVGLGLADIGAIAAEQSPALALQ